MNKKAQATLFILLAIVIVSVIILLFLLNNNFSIISNPIDNPDSYLRGCIEDSIKLTEENIFNSNAFSSKDTYSSILYKSENIPYLCISYEYYSSCMPQEPMLSEKQRILMENKAAIDLNNCVTTLKKELESKGYNINKENPSITIAFSENIIKASAKINLIATKEDSSVELKDIEIDYPSKLFNVLKLAQTIVNYESTLCEFSVMNWMATNPEILIKKDVLSDQTKVYTLQERLSLRELNFAVRTCVLPAGL